MSKKRAEPTEEQLKEAYRNGVLLWKEIQDIEHIKNAVPDGCGVTASKPLPAGTKLRVKITSNGRTFAALGKVAYANADGDIGVVFSRIEPNDQTILEKWIGELRDR